MATRSAPSGARGGPPAARRKALIRADLPSASAALRPRKLRAEKLRRPPAQRILQRISDNLMRPCLAAGAPLPGTTQLIRTP